MTKQSRRNKAAKLQAKGKIGQWRCKHDSHQNPPGAKLCEICGRGGPGLGARRR